MPVEVKGLENALKTIRKISPELYKEMNAKIRPELKLLVTASKENIPADFNGLSNWKPYATPNAKFPIFNASLVKSSYHYTLAKTRHKGSSWSNRYTVFTTAPAGRIIEFAGTRNPQGQPWVGKKGSAGHRYSHSNNPKAGAHFIASIAEKNQALKIGNRSGRVMYKALFENNGRAKKAVTDAINETLIKVGFHK